MQDESYPKIRKLKQVHTGGSCWKPLLLCPSILNAKRGIQILKEHFMNEEYGTHEYYLEPQQWRP